MPKLSTEVLQCFGDAVRSERTKRGYSQEAFAELVGVHRTYIGDVERGTRNISLINIDRIAKALGVPIGSLFPETTRGKK